MKTLPLLLTIALFIAGCSSTKETVASHTETTEQDIVIKPVVIDSVAREIDTSSAVNHPTVDDFKPITPPIEKPTETPKNTNYVKLKYKLEWSNDSLSFTADGWIEVLEGTNVRGLWLKNIKPVYKFAKRVTTTATVDSTKETRKDSFSDFISKLFSKLGELISRPLWLILAIVVVAGIIFFSFKGLITSFRPKL